jgi:hypothetical protein
MSERWLKASSLDRLRLTNLDEIRQKRPQSILMH